MTECERTALQKQPRLFLSWRCKENMCMRAVKTKCITWEVRERCLVQVSKRRFFSDEDLMVSLSFSISTSYILHLQNISIISFSASALHWTDLGCCTDTYNMRISFLTQLSDVSSTVRVESEHCSVTRLLDCEGFLNYERTFNDWLNWVCVNLQRQFLFSVLALINC